MSEDVVEAFTSGLLLMIALAVLVTISGADPTLVSGILSDAVGVYVRIAIVVMFALVLLRLPKGS